MPLSEEEQRIIHELERKLLDHDPEFVKRVRARSKRVRATLSVRWAILGFLAGFTLLLVSFRFSLVLAVVGLLIMVGAALAGEHQLRVARSGPLGQVRSSPRRAGDRFGSRFKRES
jgi:ABC-type multidrug transport system fused ATPase/permease subunit